MALAAERARATSAVERERSTNTELRMLERELRGLSRDIAEAEADLAARDRQLAAMRTELRRATTRSRRERGNQSDDRAWLDDAFLNPEERFRFEVLVAWARRIPATDKGRLPLRGFDVGPDFLPSLDCLEGIDRDKVVDVVVEVVTGLVDEVNGRELHPLRVGAGGGMPARTRDDGAICWRAALQVNTPAARRLHFWRGRDVLELSRVTTHDDMAP